MSSAGFQIPTLEPPWPYAQTIATVVSDEASSAWQRLAHQVASVAQPGGHSFPIEENVASGDARGLSRTAFLYRHANQVCGFLCLADMMVTGYREPSEGYRAAAASERVRRPAILVIWVAIEQRRRGIARELVLAAAQHSNVTPSSLAWAEPFTDSGYLLAQSVVPGGLWIVDYS